MLFRYCFLPLVDIRWLVTRVLHPQGLKWRKIHALSDEGHQNPTKFYFPGAVHNRHGDPINWRWLSFPPTTPMQCCCAVRATGRKQRTPQMWMEGRGDGCGMECFVLLNHPIWEECLQNFVAIPHPFSLTTTSNRWTSLSWYEKATVQGIPDMGRKK